MVRFCIHAFRSIGVLLGCCCWLVAGSPAHAQSYVEAQKIVASDRVSGDHYGDVLSVDGNYLMVGAHGQDYDTAGQNFLLNAGAAYILEWDGAGQYQQVQKLVASDRDAQATFGRSVAISGNYAIVGASWENYDVAGNNPMLNAGAAYFFERDTNGVWQEVQKVVASDREVQDYFGWEVNLDGTTAVVSAIWEDHNTAGADSLPTAGSLYVFERDSTGSWNEVQKLVPSDRGAGDAFGGRTAIWGNRIIAGALWEDEDAADTNTLSNAGAAYLFERDSAGTWLEVQKLVSSERDSNDNFGSNVVLEGDYALVAASGEHLNAQGIDSLYNAGAVYVFQRDNAGVWQEVQKLTSSDRQAADVLGRGLALNGNRAVISTPFHGLDAAGGSFISGAGAAYVFEQDSTGTWHEVQKLASTYRDLTDRFGWEAVLANDRVIASAQGEDYDEAEQNLESGAGATYVFVPCANTSTSMYSVTACGSYTVPSGDTLYTVSGTYFDTIPNAVGCDSVLTIQLTVPTASAATISAQACDAYTVPSGNATYTVSGTYQDTIPNVVGCDSVLTIQLTVAPTTTDSLTAYSCGPYTAPSGNTTYNASGTYVDTLLNANGCPHLLTIHLTVNQPTSATISASACGQYTVPSGTATYSTSGTFTDVIPNAAGCDSLLTIQLTVLQPTSAAISASSCGPYTAPGGQVWALSGQYTDTIPNAAGCDSIITVELLVVNPDTAVLQNGPQMTATAANSSFQWLDCTNGFATLPGETNATFTATANGSYAVQVTDSGCADTSACRYVIGVGLSEAVIAGVITVFPNPTTGAFTLRHPWQQPFTLRVFNPLGQLVHQQTITTPEADVNLGTARPGIYRLWLDTPEGPQHRAVVVTP